VAQHRHKRETNARRPKAIKVAGPIAVMATVSAVSLGVLTATPRADEFLAASSSSGASSVSSAIARDDIVSRSESRVLAHHVAKLEKKATRKAIKRADTKMWTTTELNLWAGPEKDDKLVGVVDGIEKVLLTGRKEHGRVEVVINGKSRWVSHGYFAKKKPEDGPTLGGTCKNGSSVPSGVHSGIVLVHEAVCANFPQITTYGTFRGDGEHAQGRAVDVMITGETGWQVADFLRANYAALNIEYIIFSQHIWSVERGGEGWRSMSDRGSVTANHYDHVHVTVY
jgi:uncharacterized protein YraI